MFHKLLLLFGLIVVVGTVMASEVKVSGSVNLNLLGTNDQLRFTIKVETDDNLHIDEPRLPTIPNLIFRNVYTSSSSRTSIINFRTTRSFTKEFTYVFMPANTGFATIPSINVRVGNRSFSTDPITVEITDRPSKQNRTRQPDPFDPFFSPGFGEWGISERTRGETFLLAIPEKTSIYLGEPLVISYYVYTEQGVTTLNLIDEKDYEGYGKDIFEQPSMLNFENASFRGKSYKRSLIKRTVISPNVIGKIRIPEVSATVRLFDLGYSTRNIASQTVHIEVKNLPETGKPKSFSGAVGSFNVREEFGDGSLTLGEAIYYNLVVTGRGNYNQFVAPLFEANSFLQISNPFINDNLNAGIEGIRTILYTIIPQEKGNYKLPALEFSWFDPSTSSYKIFRSKEHSISVKPANVLSYFTNFFAKDRVSRINPPVRIGSYKNLRIYLHSGWYWTIVAILLLALGASVYIASRNRLKYRDPLRWSEIKAERILRKYMKDAKLAAQNGSRDFYPLAERGLMRYLAQKYKISNRLSIPEKAAELFHKQIPPDLVRDLKSFLDRCQEVRFMPGGFEAGKLDGDLKELTTIIQNFVQIKQPFKEQNK